jgi:hypothetical protein
MFSVLRGAVGGETTIDLGSANFVAQEFGSSGPANWSDLYSGNSAIQLEAGDMLQVISSGANTAVDQLAVNMVLRKLQDIVSYN